MTKQNIIARTLKAINELPIEKAEEISDFADFISKRFEDHRLTEAIQEYASTGKTFDFLIVEEDLYSEFDLKEVYND